MPLDGGIISIMDTLQHSRTPGSQPAARERRRVVRKNFDLRVDLIQDDGSVKTSNAKNIGLGGMFLRTNPDHFHTGDTVRMEVWLDFNGRYKRCRMVARIVQIANDGFGIGFHRHDSPFFRYVYKMLYEVAHTATPVQVSSVVEYNGARDKLSRGKVGT